MVTVFTICLLDVSGNWMPTYCITYFQINSRTEGFQSGDHPNVANSPAASPGFLNPPPPRGGFYKIASHNEPDRWTSCPSHHQFLAWPEKEEQNYNFCTIEKSQRQVKIYQQITTSTNCWHANPAQDISWGRFHKSWAHGANIERALKVGCMAQSALYASKKHLKSWA